MIARPTRWVVSAILLCLAAGVALAGVFSPLLLGTGPASSAQVGVPYNSALTASGGTGFYFYSIAANPNLLPTGLVLNAHSGAITGTPTVAGTFSFTGLVSDVVDDPRSPSTGPDSQAAARRRGLAQSNPGTSAQSNYTITVSGGPSAAVGAPTSLWTLGMMMACLAGLGFFRLQQKRRA